MDSRLKQLKHWLNNELGIHVSSIVPASSDASFRRYFRIVDNGETFIVMDAPPDKEGCAPFIKISRAMAGFGLNVPRVLQQDLAQGFLLLTDLGSEQYLPYLNDTSADALYRDAMDALIALQVRGQQSHETLPRYHRQRLMDEMNLFCEWFVEKHLGVTLKTSQQTVIDDAFDYLAASALAQPQVWVHRDYHSRNLMRCNKNNPGILDFQDAVIGAVTYDLVSLLKDCYIAWPREQIECWVMAYQAKALRAGVTGIEDARQLLYWFDAMGAQRHIKVLGIFSRLNIRDGKPGYLKDMPRVLGYLIDACERIPALSDFKTLLHGITHARAMDE